MNTIPSFNEYIRQAILKNWNQNALTDYQGTTLQYHDVARKIAKLHIAFQSAGIRQGEWLRRILRQKTDTLKRGRFCETSVFFCFI